MRTLVTMALLLVATLSCGDGDLIFPIRGGACTLRGCAGGLTVYVQDAPQGPWRLEVSTDTGATRTFDGATGVSCLGAHHPDLLPGRVTIVISASGRSQRYDTTLVTLVTCPNGPQCDPACRSQNITVPLPSSPTAIAPSPAGSRQPPRTRRRARPSFSASSPTSRSVQV